MVTQCSLVPQHWPEVLSLQTADSTSACTTGRSWWKRWPRPAPKAVGSPMGTPTMPVTWTRFSSHTPRTMARGKTSRNCWTTWKGVWSSGWLRMGSMPNGSARAGSTGTDLWHCVATGPTSWRETRPVSSLTHSSFYQVMYLIIGQNGVPHTCKPYRERMEVVMACLPQWSKTEGHFHLDRDLLWISETHLGIIPE